MKTALNCQQLIKADLIRLPNTATFFKTVYKHMVYGALLVSPKSRSILYLQHKDSKYTNE